MTDKELIKAMECCSNPNGIDCEHCPANHVDCSLVVLPSVVEMVSKKDKEIARLRYEVEMLKIQVRPSPLIGSETVYI